MKYTRKSKFTNFRKNKFLFSNHINELLKDLQKKVNFKSYLSASPLVTKENEKDVPQFFHWNLKKVNKKLIINEGNKKITEFEFKHNLLYLLRKSSVVVLSLNVMTNQKYSDNEREIIELWGYKSSLLWNLVIIEKMSCQEIFDVCTGNNNGSITIQPEPNIIYCGPDGKIFGWDYI